MVTKIEDLNMNQSDKMQNESKNRRGNNIVTRYVNFSLEKMQISSFKSIELPPVHRGRPLKEGRKKNCVTI